MVSMFLTFPVLQDGISSVVYWPGKPEFAHTRRFDHVSNWDDWENAQFRYKRLLRFS